MTMRSSQIRRGWSMIGPGDIIDIRQWKIPMCRSSPGASRRNICLCRCSVRFRRRTDGACAAGKAVEGLEKYIAQNADMPTLTVAVDEFQSYTVSIVGEVAAGSLSAGTLCRCWMRSGWRMDYRRTRRVSRCLSCDEQRRNSVRFRSYPALLTGKHPR